MKPGGAKNLKADGLLLAITALWGVTFVTVKDALVAADAFSFLALRFVIAAVACAALARRELSDRRALKGGVALGLLMWGGFVLQTWGLELTTPSRSAFITGLAVVLVPVWSLVISRKRPRLGWLVGVGLAVAGLYLLTGGLAGQVDPRMVKGDWLTLGCAVVFSFHISLTERLAPGRSATAMTTSQLAVTAILSLATLPFVSTRMEWTVALVGAAAFCGIFASAVAVSVQTWAQARTSAVRAALIFSLEPVLAAGYSVALGREVLTFAQLTGGALILAGVVVAELVSAWAPNESAAFG